VSVAAFDPSNETREALDDWKASPNLTPDMDDAVIDGHDAPIDMLYAVNDE
jgi:hypothetical protein